MRFPREAAVFVYRNDRFLVLRRALERYWHVVAGVVEPSENYADAALRELREETDLEPPPPLLDLRHPQTYPLGEHMSGLYPSGTKEIVIESFAVEAPAGWEPMLNEEHDEYRWCTFDEAMALLHWPEARAALGVLRQRLRAP